jgi:membrane fusion protein (multidrug efflux system)
VAQATAALSKAQANVATNRLKAQRYEELAAIDAVSKQARDDAAVALKQSEADVEAAKATVLAAQINLGYTTVTAPISGRIGRSSVTPGALVTANQAAALATIQQLDPIYVDVTQSAADMMRMRRDIASGALKSNGGGATRVRLMLEDGSTYPATGKLEFAEVAVDPSSGAVTLRALFPNPNRQLLPGMYVRAILDEGTRSAALLVPQQAVTRDPLGKGVALVVGADGKVESRSLTIDRAVNDQWLITGGLNAGERVIVEGLQKARPGATVKPVERAATPAMSPAAAGAAGANTAAPAATATAPTSAAAPAATAKK